MKKMSLVFLAAILVLVNSSFSVIKPHFTGTVVQGVVISDKTGKPVPGAIVAVVSGEEEAVTKGKGEFRIQTAKNTPFVLTTEHGEYYTNQLTVTDVNQRIVIRLKSKGK